MYDLVMNGFGFIFATANLHKASEQQKVLILII